MLYDKITVKLTVKKGTELPHVFFFIKYNGNELFKLKGLPT